MIARLNFRRVGIVVGIALLAAAGAAWIGGVFPSSASAQPANALIIIVPYRYGGIWVFDDPSAKLVREPFVAGVPAMIDVLVKDIPDPTKGFRLIFSAEPFPGYQKKLTWLRGDLGGNYYKMDNPPMEGWLCPSLFRYYQSAPKELYVKAEAKN
jgi:hypothetical protein